MFYLSLFDECILRDFFLVFNMKNFDAGKKLFWWSLSWNKDEISLLNPLTMFRFIHFRAYFVTSCQIYQKLPIISLSLSFSLSLSLYIYIYKIKCPRKSKKKIINLFNVWLHQWWERVNFKIFIIFWKVEVLRHSEMNLSILSLIVSNMKILQTSTFRSDFE